MRDAICKKLLACLTILLVLPMAAHAMPAITCHCFTDRSYEPARPAAADPYFLATTQNSFFATVFHVDKKTIVMKKQGGTSPDDLWIAYWVASKSGMAPDTLLQARQKNKSWEDILTPMRLTAKIMGNRFTTALNTKLSSARLAETVVDELFLSYQLQSEVELTAVRQAGATNQELIISTVIAAKTGQPVRQIYLEAKGGLNTWGYLLQKAKIDTKNMQREISAILTLKNFHVSEK
jgi:hypothetical protein